MNAYSEDLRKKIVVAVERGMPKTETARTFGVGISSVKRYVATYREGRSLVPKKRPGSKPKLDEHARRLLESHLEERPAATLPGRRALLPVILRDQLGGLVHRLEQEFQGGIVELFDPSGQADPRVHAVVVLHLHPGGSCRQHFGVQSVVVIAHEQIRKLCAGEFGTLDTPTPDRKGAKVQYHRTTL
jgi:transposase